MQRKRFSVWTAVAALSLLLGGMTPAWGCVTTSAALPAPGTHYLHYDHRGDLVMVTDATGAVVESRRYGAWGCHEQRQGDIGVARSAESVRYSWGGHERDATGLYYLGARYYDPVWGRFLSADPARQGASPYAALGDEPLAHVDPDGRFWIRLKKLGYTLRGKRFTFDGKSEFAITGNPDLKDWAKVPKSADPLPTDLWYAPKGSGEKFHFLHNKERAYLTKPPSPAALAVIRKRVNRQRQQRHILGEKQYRGGGYLANVDDGQKVLDAFHSGETTMLGRNAQDFPVVRYEGVTGTNVNSSAGIDTQPTHVFLIKGSKEVSIVPMNPKWVSRP